MRQSEILEDLAWKVLSQRVNNINPFVWVELLPMFQRHHLTGYVFYNYQNSIDPMVAPAFEEQWKLNWQRNELTQRLVDPIFREAGQAGIQITPIKGYSLKDSVYPNRGCRFLSDVDILVTPEGLRELKTILPRFDFFERSSSRWEANHFKTDFVSQKDGRETVLEVHTSLLPFRESFTDFLNPRITQNSLKLEDEFVYLCGHAGYQHGYNQLFWALDLARFVETHQGRVDWEEIHEVSKIFDLRESVDFGAYLLKCFFRIRIPALMRNNLFRGSDKKRLSSTLWNPGRNPLSVFRLKWSLRGGLKENLKWLNRTSVQVDQSPSSPGN